VISRKTGAELPVQYVTEAFFFLHTVNAFEADDHLIVDICCYANAKMLDCMYIDALEVKKKIKNLRMVMINNNTINS
jgi:carotenoid isomerooxygenase